MADGRIYMLQPSFAAGEISPDVASRVDLDKYQSALLQAENVFVRPYGSAYRRPGTEHMADLGTGAVRLQEFAVDADTSYLLVFKAGYIYVYQGATLKDTISSTGYTASDLPNLRFAQSADVMFIASGRLPVKKLTRVSDTQWTLSRFVPAPGYFDTTTMTDGVSITPSAVRGTATLTASSAVFSEEQKGNFIMLRQSVPAATRKLSGTGDTNGLLTSTTGWKVISHGTWTGTFDIEYCETNSNDDADWQTLRSYSSSDDFNVTESGTFDDQMYIRLNATISSGTFEAVLTRLPYTNEGWGRITTYTNSTHVDVAVGKKFSSTTVASTDWAFGSWDDNYGYPSCVTFFQDRLVFAANDRQPYMVWMSRTGDYYNFGVERVDGTLTDDSAVALSFISRRDFRILHLMAEADLLIMTEGNEWIISGNEVVTPTSVTPQVQTSRGSANVDPVMIGGQMVYVQRHGRTVRDMQYNYVTDSYDGMDLTILAKHITQDATIIDSAYRQEPDYMMFFVLDDGTLGCLTYVNEQKVYAWCRFVTDGDVIAVQDVTTPEYDDIYFVVERDGTNYLERLADYPHSTDPDDYIMLDCAAQGTNNPAADTITASWLAGMTVDVLADGRHIRDLEADNTGTVTLPVECSKYVIGIPYTSTWELPNIEIQLQDGTMQGRRKKVAEAILRLEYSLGGRIGLNTDKTDVIKYDELMAQSVTLYSGEKNVTVPNVTAGGFNDKGRIVVTSDEPYPLSISSIVRAIVAGG